MEPRIDVHLLTLNEPAEWREACIASLDGAPARVPHRILLNSRDPAIKTIKDFKDSDRIAVPADSLVATAEVPGSPSRKR